MLAMPNQSLITVQWSSHCCVEYTQCLVTIHYSSYPQHSLNRGRWGRKVERDPETWFCLFAGKPCHVASDSSQI